MIDWAGFWTNIYPYVVTYLLILGGIGVMFAASTMEDENE